MFYTTTFINEVAAVYTLVDDGSQSYAQINEAYARQLSLPLLEVNPRNLGGVFKGPITTIRHVTYFSLDIGGIKTTNVFAYVVPQQHEKLILGKPWYKDNDVVLYAAEDKLHIGRYGIDLFSNEVLEKKSPSITQVSASTFGGLARRAKKRRQDIQCFAASLSDIDKALKPKATVTREDVLAALPQEYHGFIDTFDPEKIAALPPHRPGMDIEIKLEKDVTGKEKEVP